MFDLEVCLTTCHRQHACSSDLSPSGPSSGTLHNKINVNSNVHRALLTRILQERVCMSVCVQLCACVWLVIIMLVENFKTAESNKERILTLIPPPAYNHR